MQKRDKVNVLVVDDEPAKLLTYQAVLAELDETLLFAKSAREALERLLHSDIAVVLLDVKMPEMDGFELARMIHEHPRFENLAIIFISGVYLTDNDQLTGYRHGAVDYISVPIIPDLLRAKVKVFAELYRKTRQLEHVNRQMAQLSSRMIAIQDEERRKVARELHDTLGQQLTLAKMAVNSIRTPEAQQQVNEASAQINDALRQVRSISQLLHPPLLDETGLRSALRHYIEGLDNRSTITLSLEIQPEDFPRLAPELELTIYRIIQEGLTNVFRHSGAGNACVRIVQGDNKILIQVKDDGKGFNGEVSRSGVGIEGMRQRLGEFNGRLELRKGDPGTILEVVIPFVFSQCPKPACASS